MAPAAPGSSSVQQCRCFRFDRENLQGRLIPAGVASVVSPTRSGLWFIAVIVRGSKAFLRRASSRKVTMANYRIAISGPAGAGKTTLANALGEALSLPVLPENLETIYARRRAFLDSQAPPAAPESRQWAAVWAWMDSHFEWCEAHAGRTADLPGFVADRWEMDIMSNWIRVFSAHDANDKTRRLHHIWQERAKFYDLVVVLPVSSFEIEPRNDAGMKRRLNMTVQLMAHAVVAGLATLIQPAEKVLHIPQDTSVAERIDLVIARLRTLGKSG